MIYHPSPIAIGVFLFFVGTVLGLSFFLGRKAKSSQGFFAAHGSVHWFVNGVAFAGDYLSAASFLGICGMIAFYGYDGFLYSIGFLAGWIVALFVIAEPLKRLGRYTFADALDSRFNSRGIKLAAAVSTLIVSLFYLIPQMVGAGSLVKPLLGLEHYQGVLLVGVIVILIVVTAGMVSTTWVQFIKGSMLVVFCFALTIMILNRGLTVKNEVGTVKMADVQASIVPLDKGLEGKPYVQIKNQSGNVTLWRIIDEKTQTLAQTQTMLTAGDRKFINGSTISLGQQGALELHEVGSVAALAGGKTETGALGPLEYFGALAGSSVVQWIKEDYVVEKGSLTVWYPKFTDGASLMLPGNSPTFKGVKGDRWQDKLNFISLMLALFGGTASLPHILIRYYTVKDQASARKSTVAGIATIGFFYTLTLYLGFGAMTSGALDVTDQNMSAPLLARSFGPLPFAVISAIAFTTVLGTVSGLIIAASGAVVHDIMTGYMKLELSDHHKVRAGKIAAVVVGILAMILGMIFKTFNVGFLVGWAFNIAASANLPALIMLLFWKGTTKQGITFGILAGLFSSLIWILLSQDAYNNLYDWKTKVAPMPFNQPGIVTIPLGFVVLVVVSLMTKKKA